MGKSEIYKILEEFPYTWFTSLELSELLPEQVSSITHALNKMFFVTILQTPHKRWYRYNDKGKKVVEFNPNTFNEDIK